MKSFKYPPLYKIVLKYSNIFMTIILMAYLVPLVSASMNNLLIIIPAFTAAVIIIWTNRFYYKTYKNIAFTIDVGKDIITGSGFMFSRRIVKIKFENIDSISGGVFGLNPKGLIFIHDSTNGAVIAVHPSIEGVNELLHKIIKNVNESLREDLIKKIQQKH